MKPTTPLAIAVAATATWGLSPLAATAVAIGVSAGWTLLQLVRMAMRFQGPRVIDPNDPPYKG